MNSSWETKKEKLTKTYTFEDFQEALNFVNEVGEIAEEMQHHPDIKIHDYRSVTIETYTHDTDSITQKDHSLAEKIDALV